MSKFSAGGNRFLENRAELAKAVGVPNLYEFIDQFALYAGMQTLGNKLFTYELLKQTLDIPGHVMEFGCWKGANLMFMAKILALLQPHSIKRVIGFDNFSGLPEPTEVDGPFAKACVGRYCGDEALLSQAIQLFEFEGYVELVKGDALVTIPEFQRQRPEVLVSFAYIDFDLYEPVKVALTYLEEVLVVGGIVAFDEGIALSWPGETVALKEFLATTKHKFEMINNSMSRQPTMAIRRVA